MSDVVIRAEGLGKKYLIGHKAANSVPTIRDSIVLGVGRAARATGDLMRGKPIVGGDKIEEFWALKDLDFTVRRGDVVGIIGNNGAGKSTLLKVLSRITEPTVGRVEIKGRVASLLEVGTGFHPELTARENIYLNGAILGMSRSEIRRKFDEIVGFAEVSRFLDTPVKRFSSGMYVRLAFAVAAHLEPEVLIVDEVLAVGDADFQRKCLGKMDAVSKEGRTILFVSHNLAAIEQICRSAVLLDKGRIASTGSPTETIRDYLRKRDSTAGGPSRKLNTGEKVKLTKIAFHVDGQPTRSVRSGDQCEFLITYALIDADVQQAPSISLTIFVNGQLVTNLWTDSHQSITKNLGQNTVSCSFVWPFVAGSVEVNVYSHYGPVAEDWIENAVGLQSFAGPYFDGSLPPSNAQGVVYIPHVWKY